MTVAAPVAAATYTPAEPPRTRTLPVWVQGLAGGVGIVLIWELFTVTVESGNRLWPTPWSIAVQMNNDGWHFYWPNIETTASEAIKGFLWGNLLAIGLAMLVLLIPMIERPLVQLSVVSYCLPIVAIGPIFAIVFSGEVPKVALAAMACFFTTLIGMLLGLRSADRTSLDLVRAYGGGSYQQLVKVRVRSALPSLFAALRIAAPAAVLGAIIGEYMGGDRGLGVAMINSEQALDISRTWGIAIAATVMGSVGFGAVALVGRIMVPPTQGTVMGAADAGAALRSKPLGGRNRQARAVAIGRGALRALVTLVVILAAWELFLKAFHVSSFIGKGPLDVWRYVVTGPDAASHRSALWGDSGVTLRDAFLGLAGGTAAAIACSLAFSLSRAASSAFLPLAMVLRSVPLVAMTPLIVGVFGRTLAAITVIGGIVTFFPTLVNVTLALRRTPKEAIELCRAYGAGPGSTLWKVQIPNALPSLFASLRIAAPLSLVGALLAEWLATGKGLGYKILTAAAVSDYNGLWTRVVLVTLYSAVLYQLIGAAERLVLARFSSTG